MLGLSSGYTSDWSFLMDKQYLKKDCLRGKRTKTNFFLDNLSSNCTRFQAMPSIQSNETTYDGSHSDTLTARICGNF